MGVGVVLGVPLTGPLGVTGRYLSFVPDLRAAGEGATSGRVQPVIRSCYCVDRFIFFLSKFCIYYGNDFIAFRGY